MTADEWFVRLEAALAGLDRVTDAPKLKDSERPIWDVFETGDKPPARPAR
jgi:hypothetical protein